VVRFLAALDTRTDAPVRRSGRSRRYFHEHATPSRLDPALSLRFLRVIAFRGDAHRHTSTLRPAPAGELRARELDDDVEAGRRGDGRCVHSRVRAEPGETGELELDRRRFTDRLGGRF